MTENEENQENEVMKKQYTYAIAYARVSTDDKDQNPESQLVAIRKWVKQKGDIIVLKEFKDEVTGTDDERPGLDSAYGFIMRNHRNEKSKLVQEFIVLDMDRLSRNMTQTNRLIDALSEMGVRLRVITNENVDYDSKEGKLMAAFNSYSAQAYVDGLGDKIRAGQERARQEGKWIGRPLKRVNSFDEKLLLGYASMGYSLRDVAKIHNCARITITRRLQDLGKLDEYKRLYAEAIGQGKKGPALICKKYKPKKSDRQQSEQNR